MLTSSTDLGAFLDLVDIVDLVSLVSLVDDLTDLVEIVKIVNLMRQRIADSANFLQDSSFFKLHAPT